MGDRAAGFHFGVQLGACGVASMQEKGRSVSALNQIVFLSLCFLLLVTLFCFSFTCVGRGCAESGGDICLFVWVSCFVCGVPRSAKEDTV